ncbi:MAG: hypothetical protein ACRD0K_27465, partial [Egibacteraceae bacterium]
REAVAGGRGSAGEGGREAVAGGRGSAGEGGREAVAGGRGSAGEGGREAVAGGRGSAGHGEWLAPIRKTIGSTAQGVGELADAIDEHHAWLRGTDRLHARRLDRARLQLREIALGEVRARFEAIGSASEGELVEKLAQQVADRQLDPYTAADLLLAQVDA